MIELIKPNYKNMNISRNANSRNKRKMIVGFKVKVHQVVGLKLLLMVQ